MKLTVFQAADGDCNLLTGKDGKRLLVDGGRQGSFRACVAPALGQLAEAGGVIDLVCLSHIDGDHIEGLLELMDNALAWRVYDYQISRGNLGFRKPDSPRPPAMLGLWHNSFKDVAAENTAPIQSQIVANANSLMSLPEMAGFVAGHQELAASIEDSLRLANRAGPSELRIPVNAPWQGKTVLAPTRAERQSLGGMRLFVLAPFERDLEKQRRDWNRWLAKSQKTVDKVRRDADRDAKTLPLTEGQLVLSSIRDLATALGERKLVTPPNLASIMLLVEEDGRRILLTGDGHADDILKGLRLQRKLDRKGQIQVNVLKVQHHGAEHNITEDFCARVIADQYIFCANGASANPDLRVLQAIYDARIQVERPFTFWFNSNSQLAGGAEKAAHMRQVEALVGRLKAGSAGKMNAVFSDGSAAFEMEV